MSAAVSRVNAGRPVSISWSTVPTLKMSERASTGFAAHLLRRHIACGAHHHAFRGLRRQTGMSAPVVGGRCELGDAEVENLDASVAP